MGNIEFLGGANTGPKSVEDSIFEVENCSIVFKSCWELAPPDIDRAGKVSAKALEHLDHIVNEILRARDTSMSKLTFSGSQLEASISQNMGQMVSPVTRQQQEGLISLGAGNGQLPSTGVDITFVKLINKIKHRHHQTGNFRIDSGRHKFLINVDKQNKTPDSIVEFDVLEFCEHCKGVSQHL